MVIKTWLKGNVPEPAQVAELPKLRDLQETIMLAGGAEQRMLGAFAPTPNQSGKWRYWRDSEDRKDEDYKRGRGDVTVTDSKAPLEIPVFVDIEATYGKARDRLLENPLGDGVAEAFAQQSGELADRIATHRALPPNTNVAHPLQDSYEELGEALEAACRRATLAARGFEAAAEKNGLRNLLRP